MKPKMIIPMLVCRDPVAEIEFCEHSFDAVELSRREGQGGNRIGKVTCTEIWQKKELQRAYRAEVTVHAKKYYDGDNAEVGTFISVKKI